jgi:hypothetical protein
MSRKGTQQDDLYVGYEGDVDADDAISLADFFPTRHAGVRRAGVVAEWLA